MTKTVCTLILTYPHQGREDSERFRVESITGSTEYAPGNIYTRKEVDEIIRRPSFTVTIRRNTGKT